MAARRSLIRRIFEELCRRQRTTRRVPSRWCHFRNRSYRWSHHRLHHHAIGVSTSTVAELGKKEGRELTILSLTFSSPLPSPYSVNFCNLLHRRSLAFSAPPSFCFVLTPRLARFVPLLSLPSLARTASLHRLPHQRDQNAHAIARSAHGVPEFVPLRRQDLQRGGSYQVLEGGEFRAFFSLQRALRWRGKAMLRNKGGDVQARKAGFAAFGRSSAPGALGRGRAWSAGDARKPKLQYEGPHH